MLTSGIMQTLAAKKYNRGFLISSLVSLLLYILILNVKIPSSFSQLFQRYSIFLFLLLLGLYYLSFRLSGLYSLLAGSCITLVFFALPLSYLWTSGFSVKNIIGGIVPYKDGFHHFNNAQLLFSGKLIPSWNLYRPMFSGFLSSLLLLTQQNMKWAIAILVALTGICIYYSGRRAYNSLGAPAASIYLTLLYFYIQPFIGRLSTEWLGLALGCLAFIQLWKAARTLKISDLLFGIVILMASASARAGAFIVFPLLAIWSGWFFINKKRFSIPVAGIATVTILVSFLLANKVYSQQVVEPGGSTFSNFAYVIYSHVMGGTSWNHARIDLGYKISPEEIYRAALQEFLDHPISIFIAIPKTYRDFFIPSGIGIFNFRSSGWTKWLDIMMWGLMLILLFWGFIKSVKKQKSSFSILLVTVFIGIFLSIPFLPPHFGGNRFYASTMPFFFVLISISIWEIIPQGETYASIEVSLLERTAYTLSVLMVILTFIVPILIHRNSNKPVITIPECPRGQVPFAVKVNPNSYVDIIPEETASCGLAPKICQSDFIANTRVKGVDPLFQQLVSYAESSDTSTRILISINQLGKVKNSYRYFVGTSSQLQPVSSSNIISGCARKSETKILLFVTTIVNSVELNDKMP